MSDADIDLDETTLLTTLCDRKRAAILKFAKELADAGAHYLWGAEGQVPTKSGAVRYTAISFSKDSPSFCAAQINGNVCVGRFGHPDVKGRWPSAKIASPLSNDVSDFLASYADCNDKPEEQNTWPKEILTPRRIKGYAGGDSTECRLFTAARERRPWERRLFGVSPATFNILIAVDSSDMSWKRSAG